jgi:predicted nucleotidyltransferase
MTKKAAKPSGTTQQKFTEALEELVAEVKRDKSILAAVLCGSLSHDTVWARSDIDLLLITADDKKGESSSVALYSNGVNVHALLMSRTKFRQMAEGSLRNSFIHSFLTKGRILYTDDDTISALWTRLQEIGERDTQIQLLRAGIQALAPVDKAHKWLITRGDLDYSALWILSAATALARIEIIKARRLTDREVIPQAMQLNPAFFKIIYSDLLNTKKTVKNVQAALDAIDAYLSKHTPALFGLVIDYLREVGDTRSASDLEVHFSRNLDVEGVTSACEYLADRGLICKVSTPIQLTKRSNISVQEMAFAYMQEAEDVY